MMARLHPSTSVSSDEQDVLRQDPNVEAYGKSAFAHEYVKSGKDGRVPIRIKVHVMSLQNVDTGRCTVYNYLTSYLPYGIYRPTVPVPCMLYTFNIFTDIQPIIEL